MISIKQLLRQPFKLCSGIALASLAVSILTICFGQHMATTLSREDLDDRYTTIGLLSEEYLWVTKDSGGKKKLSDLPAEIQNWIDDTVQTRADIIQSVSHTGLISAYIPELDPDNFSRHENGYHMGDLNYGYPYRCAMLTVTLTRIGTKGADAMTYYTASDGKLYEYVKETVFLCVGTVESVVGLEKGFLPPEGKTIVLQIKVPSKEAFDELNLKVGQTYLVYGEDYAADSKFDFKTRILDSHFGGVRSFISTTVERKEIAFSNAENHLGLSMLGNKGA